MADPSRFTLNLGDFGISRQKVDSGISGSMTTVGTWKYMAPEIRSAFLNNQQHSRYNRKADIFSAALTILVLFTKEFKGNFNF